MLRHLVRLHYRRYATTAATLTLLFACPGSVRGQRTEFAVVVNAENAVTELPREALSRIFLRKDDFWKHGVRIIVVDQPGDTRIFRGFARAIHRRAPTAVASYWQQQIFSGRRLPPLERRGDQAVLAFVRANPEAIGYVAASTPIPTGVKAVAVR